MTEEAGLAMCSTDKKSLSKVSTDGIQRKAKSNMKIKDIKIMRKFHDSECKLTKTLSKRSYSSVAVGANQTGNVEIIEIDKLVAVLVSGRGFNYLRTSCIVKVIESTKDIVQFETQGGIYILEKLKGEEQ